MCLNLAPNKQKDRSKTDLDSDSNAKVKCIKWLKEFRLCVCVPQKLVRKAF